MDWKFIGSTTNDSFLINGLDIFKENWKSTGEVAEVIDPLYGTKRHFSIWSVIQGGEEIIFAAGEYSNGVWGIYSKVC